MSTCFGAVAQNGYVVPDLEAAVAHWATVLGVGPWHVIADLPIEQALYRGQATAARATIALAFSGALQIELIQPLNDAPSPYRDFLMRQPDGGLQHLSSWPDSESFDRGLTQYLAAGGEILFQGAVGATRFVYLQTEAHPGTCFELADLSQGTKRIFAAMQAEAAVWDGGMPIRTGWPQTQP